MSPRIAVLVIALALVLAGVAWMLWAPSSRDQPAEAQSPEVQEAVVVTTDQPMTPASLYFIGLDGWLHGVEIEVPAEDGEERIWALVNALIAGPRGAQESSLASPVPAGVRLDGVYFMETSTVALDLRFQPLTSAESTGVDAAEVEAEPAGDAAAQAATVEDASTFLGRMGTKQELLTIYSLVNTVALGSESVDRVILLIDGKQPETLAGHIDLTRPLSADSSWIHESSRVDG